MYNTEAEVTVTVTGRARAARRSGVFSISSLEETTSGISARRSWAISGTALVSTLKYSIG